MRKRGENMKKSCFGLLFAFFILLFICNSCATNAVKSNKSEISIIFASNDWDIFGKLNIYIDGKKVKTIKSGKNLVFQVQNGHHTRTVDWAYKLFNMGVASAPKASMQFNANSNRIVFSVELTSRLLPEYERLPPDPSDPARYAFGLNLTIDTVFSIGGNYIVEQNSVNSTVRQLFEVIANEISENKTVAIMPISNYGSNIDNQVEEELTKCFLESKRNQVIDRRNLRTLLNEHNFQQSEYVDDSFAESLGKMLGAQYMILYSRNQEGTGIRIRLRVLEVETGQVVSIASRVH
jgi:TolB-like protein